MSFILVYGVKAAMSMEYIVPSLCIATLIHMADYGVLEEWIA